MELSLERWLKMTSWNDYIKKKVVQQNGNKVVVKKTYIKTIKED